MSEDKKTVDLVKMIKEQGVEGLLSMVEDKINQENKANPADSQTSDVQGQFIRDLEDRVNELSNENLNYWDENNQLRCALELLKQFCLDSGLDLTPLIGSHKKPIKDMSKEELIEANKDVVKRQATKLVRSKETEPFPSFEEQMKKYEEQTEKSISGALVGGIVRYLQHTGNIEKQ